MARLTNEELLERAMDAADTGDNIGICKVCANEQGGVAPDARGFTCEVCGRDEVYGAAELVDDLA